MAHITFYTKLGCATAAKQIALLKQAGHTVDVHDLLAEAWTAETLLSFFGDLPVTEWFNTKSPRVKEGEIDPAAYDRESALALLLTDHLLIHRPLIETDGVRCCGFDPVALHDWLGLGETVFRRSAEEDFISCSQPSGKQVCP